MENRSHALIAGLFSLLLGFSAVAALWWFGGKHEAINEYLVINTRNASGLNLQAQVRYRDIRVGKVEAIDLDPKDPRNTLIRISVKKNIPITRGTTSKLGYQGLTGLAHVLLEDSGKDATPLESSGSELARIPMQDSMLQELSDVGGETVRNARDFLVNANQVLNPENRQNIARTLANIEATTSNAKEATAQLRQLVTPENVRLMKSTLVHLEQTTGQAGPFLVEARGLVLRLQSVSDKLETTLGDTATEGVSALIPKLNELSSSLSSNSHQLSRVLQMLEESPQSLILGKPNALPGPGESGFVAPVNIKGQP